MDARPGGAVDLLILHRCNLIQHRYVDDELIFARSVKRVTRAVPGTGATTLAVMKYCLTAKHGGDHHSHDRSVKHFPLVPFQVQAILAFEGLAYVVGCASGHNRYGKKANADNTEREQKASGVASDRR